MLPKVKHISMYDSSVGIIRSRGDFYVRGCLGSRYRYPALKEDMIRRVAASLGIDARNGLDTNMSRRDRTRLVMELSRMVRTTNVD